MTVERTLPGAEAPAPAPDVSRRRRMLAPALVVGGIAAASLALHLRDPHEQGSWGQCPSAAMGVYCPGCGGLRAVNDLTNGRFLDAASSNLLFVASIPVLVYVFARWTAGRWTGRSWQAPDRSLRLAAWVAAVATTVFVVLRNTAAGSWLAP